MKNENISKMLRYYRRLNNYSVNEVSEILKENNNYAAPKTIYGWENGTTQPNADMLLLLCDLYHIENILESFGYKNTENQELYLTSLEKDLVRKYREHPELQDAINKLLDISKED